MSKSSSKKSKNSPEQSAAPVAQKHDIRPGQSIELLKELHILTRDGAMNQDSRRKLKQVYHLYQFIEPLLQELAASKPGLSLVDHGAGKSYLGFILYDLFFKPRYQASDESCDERSLRDEIYGIEARAELVERSRELAQRLGFHGMQFLATTVENAIDSQLLPAQIDMVTALHACDTATDDAIRFAIERRSQYVVLVPCCQAEIAAALRDSMKGKSKTEPECPLAELWKHPIHTREFGSHVTNVLRALQLESHGYQVTVTELVGWEHSMKNELIIAQLKRKPNSQKADRLRWLLAELGITEALKHRFFLPSDFA